MRDFIILLITINEIIANPVNHRYINEEIKRFKREINDAPVENTDHHITTTENLYFDEFIKLFDELDTVTIKDKINTEIQKSPETEISTSAYETFQPLNTENVTDVEKNKYGGPIEKKEYHLLCSDSCSSQTLTIRDQTVTRKKRGYYDSDNYNKIESMFINTPRETKRLKRGFFDAPKINLPKPPKLEMPFGITDEREVKKEIKGIGGSGLQFSFGVHNRTAESKDRGGIKIYNPLTDHQIDFNLNWTKDSKQATTTSKVGSEIHSPTTQKSTIFSSYKPETDQPKIPKFNQQEITDVSIKDIKDGQRPSDIGQGQVEIGSVKQPIFPGQKETAIEIGQPQKINEIIDTSVKDIHGGQHPSDLGHGQGQVEIGSITQSTFQGQKETEIEIGQPQKIKEIIDTSVKDIHGGQHPSDIGHGQGQVEIGSITQPTFSGQKETEIGQPQKINEVTGIEPTSKTDGHLFEIMQHSTSPSSEKQSFISLNTNIPKDTTSFYTSTTNSYETTESVPIWKLFTKSSTEMITTSTTPNTILISSTEPIKQSDNEFLKGQTEFVNTDKPKGSKSESPAPIFEFEDEEVFQKKSHKNKKGRKY